MLIPLLIAACARMNPPADPTALRPAAPVPIAEGGLGAQAGPGTPVVRIGGDMAAVVIEETRKGKEDGSPFTAFRFDTCLIDTPLPQGYPAPTPPGAIDLKWYPSVRRAEVTRKDNPDGFLGLTGGQNSAFWPLFRHIESRGIAMTSPVEMDYTSKARVEGGEAKPRTREWTMSFLYRTPDMGEPGPAEKNVIVRDQPEMLVLSLGRRGDDSEKSNNRDIDALREWLAAHPQAGLREAGAPRTLTYNDPFVRERDRWSEVQLIVVRDQTGS
ncbi:MAG: heme-binding protein [Phycisphaerales bacterium]|nr:heme-binding protein [Phycisphaerales bacterium]